MRLLGDDLALRVAAVANAPVRRQTILDDLEVAYRVEQVIQEDTLLWLIAVLTDPLELVDHPKENLRLEG